MTGYGKAVAETAQKKITVEIKSLNSKQFDLNTKVPWLYKEKELEIRNMISQLLDRGKIDFSIYFDMLEDEGIPVINKTVVKSYFRQLREMASELDVNVDDQIMPIIMRFPDSLKTEKPELTEDEWNLVRERIVESVNTLDLYRTTEGKSIEDDLRKRIWGYSSALPKLRPSSPEELKK